MNRPHETPELIAKINGLWAGDGLQSEFQREVANHLKRNDSRKFPGAQPVSFAKQHLAELKTQDYYVCEKTDGLRVLMYLTYDEREGVKHPVIYLIDRRNDFYYVNGLRFPIPEDPRFEKFHVDTILDGELVEDKLPNGKTLIKYLAFDCMLYQGKDLRERPLDKRLGYMKEFVLRPYNKWLRDVPENQREPQPFKVEDKKTEFSYSLAAMFNEIIPQVKQLHGNDGLIFTCKGTNYVSGTDPHILKWKPPNENTVDFLMQIQWPVVDPDPNDPDQSPQQDYFGFPAKIELFIFHGRNQDYSYVGDLYVTPEEWENMKELDQPLQDAIVECYLEDLEKDAGHPANGGSLGTGRRWRFYRLREDKDEANHISTFDSVKVSIEDHVTQQDLLDHADEIRAAWKSRDARRQSTRAA